MSAKRPATRRVNRGRGHSYLLDGDKAAGVTTILGNGMPKPALVSWAAKTIAETVVDRLDYDEATGHWYADRLIKRLEERARSRQDKFRPDSRLDLLEQLRWVHYDDRDAAANRGTEVHKLAERLARGEEVEVPDELIGHVDAYLQFREDFKPVDELLELTVVNRKCRYMGTLDLIARLEAIDQTLLIDIKTNRSGPFGEVALQLAGYRFAEVIVEEDGTERPMPPVDGCAVLWLRADGYDLKPVRADERLFMDFRYVQQVARFAEETSRDVIGDALRPGVRA